ncbi:MAG: hypothetical protein D6780_04310 [Candidatus Dadabacteria bacterium]|nr:MAG: hypothetical protein D6780_04310 [Candidatus Dadabacteria bacterium]
MIEAWVIGDSASSRNKFLTYLQEVLTEADKEGNYTTVINFKPLSPDEIRFNAAPHLCLISADTVLQDLVRISKIKAELPNVPLLVQLPKELEKVAIIEQLARFGVEGFITSNTTPTEVLAKIILLAKGREREKSGKLILVIGAKGGVGATTITAAVCEKLVEKGKKTVAIDLNCRSQDLSRFLQVRPYLNENFQLLLEGSKPVNKEHVLECIGKVWEDEENFWVLTPPALNLENSMRNSSKTLRIFLSIVEILDKEFDYTLIDLSHQYGVVKNALLKVADQVILVTNNDPASSYAFISEANELRKELPVSVPITLVDNCCFPDGLESSLLRSELETAMPEEGVEWIKFPVLYNKAGAKWAGSSSTLYSLSSKGTVKGIEAVVNELGDFEEENLVSQKESGLSVIKEVKRSLASKVKSLVASRDGKRVGEQKSRPQPIADYSAQHKPLSNKELLELPSASLLSAVVNESKALEKTGNKELIVNASNPAQPLNEHQRAKKAVSLSAKPEPFYLETSRNGTSNEEVKDNQEPEEEFLISSPVITSQGRS